MIGAIPPLPIRLNVLMHGENSVARIHLSISLTTQIGLGTPISQSVKRLDYGLGDRDIGVPFPTEIFLWSVTSRPVPTHPHIEWIPVAVSLGMKRWGCKADHSPTSNALVKNGGAMGLLPLPPYVFMASYLVKPKLTAMGIRCADHATPSIR
jgi:hypothetical protein